jgi:hypothetical protein
MHAREESFIRRHNCVLFLGYVFIGRQNEEKATSYFYFNLPPKDLMHGYLFFDCAFHPLNFVQYIYIHIYTYIQYCNMYRLVCMVGKLILTDECTTVLCISVHVNTNTYFKYR